MKIRRNAIKMSLPLMLLACAVLFASRGASLSPLIAQGARLLQIAQTAHEDHASEEARRIAGAVGILCAERRRDALGSMAIDEMQMRPELALNDPSVRDGVERAKRLLPVARKLTINALRQLAHDYKIDSKRSRVIAARIQAVSQITPDMELRDNALVLVEEPRTIYFGTIFLAGLQSDEGMISVLAHELTHIGDGGDNNLYALFQGIGNRATRLTNLEITDPRAEELTCDLVGAIAARLFVAQAANTNSEPFVQRLARSVEHNCVTRDDTDDEHLSPRDTLRAVLALDPTLARGIINGKPDASPSQAMHH